MTSRAKVCSSLHSRVPQKTSRLCSCPFYLMENVVEYSNCRPRSWLVWNEILSAKSRHRISARERKNPLLSWISPISSLLIKPKRLSGFWSSRLILMRAVNSAKRGTTKFSNVARWQKPMSTEKRYLGESFFCSLNGEQLVNNGTEGARSVPSFLRNFLPWQDKSLLSRLKLIKSWNSTCRDILFFLCFVVEFHCFLSKNGWKQYSISFGAIRK